MNKSTIDSKAYAKVGREFWASRLPCILNLSRGRSCLCPEVEGHWELQKNNRDFYVSLTVFAAASSPLLLSPHYFMWEPSMKIEAMAFPLDTVNMHKTRADISREPRLVITQCYEKKQELFFASTPYFMFVTTEVNTGLKPNCIVGSTSSPLHHWGSWWHL